MKEFAFCMKLKFADKEEARVRFAVKRKDCATACTFAPCNACTGDVEGVAERRAISHHWAHLGGP